MLREIKSTQRLVRELLFKVTGTGTAVIDSGNFDATLTDNGTGDYSLTLTVPGQRLLGIFVEPIATAGDVIGCAHASSTASVPRIVLFDATDGTTAKDGVFFCKVIVSDAADQT